MLYARYLAALGRFDQAQEQAERARQIDPVALSVNMVVAQVLFYARRYDAAIARLGKVIEMNPYWREPEEHWPQFDECMARFKLC